MSARSCGTCTKPVYPKEKIGISDIWFHKSCLKCSVCSSTLSLNSVYVSIASGQKQIYCKVDVPRAIHTAVVDSIALRRALSAPKPDNPGPKALRTGSMRFKGLTLRSKGMRGGMEAPKLNVVAGTGQVVVGMVKGSTLDSWDIQRAMEVQAFTSSPLSSHPAIQAQRTGSSANNSFMSPSILLPQVTGNGAQNGIGGGQAGEDGEDDGIARENKGEKEEMPMEKDLVKNLLRTFQLTSLELVALPPSSPTLPPNTTSTGPGTFSTLKLSNTLLLNGGLTDLTSISTLGTRRSPISPLALDASKPPKSSTLQSMFDDPSLPKPDPVVESKKTVRISDKVPSIIAAFVPSGGSLISAFSSSSEGGSGSGSGEEADDEDEGWDGEGPGEERGMGEEEMMRRMEEVGLEVVMVYEEEPEAEKVGVAV